MSTPHGSPAVLIARTRSSRARGLGVPGSRSGWRSLVLHPDRDGEPDRDVARGGRDRRQVAPEQRPLGEDRERRAGGAERADHPGHELVAPLGPLVRIGVRAERDVLAPPARRASSARRTSTTLTLTTISRSKPVPVSSSSQACVRARSSRRRRAYSRDRGSWSSGTAPATRPAPRSVPTGPRPRGTGPGELLAVTVRSRPEIRSRPGSAPPSSVATACPSHRMTDIRTLFEGSSITTNPHMNEVETGSSERSLRVELRP